MTFGFAQRAVQMLATLYPKITLLQSQCPVEVHDVYCTVDNLTCYFFEHLQTLLFAAENRAIGWTPPMDALYCGPQH